MDNDASKLKARSFMLIKNEDDERYMVTVPEFIAGWISGIGGLMLSHPMDTIKVNYQDSSVSIKQSISHIYECCGIRGFYKGITVPAAMAGIQNSLFFGVYQNAYRISRQFIRDPNKEILRTYISGTAGAMVQVIVTNPVEIMKIRLQTRFKERQLNVFKSINKMYKLHGLRGFYRGFVPTALRDVPSGGLYFHIYEYSDKFLGYYVGYYLGHVISGGLAGALSYAPMIPFDVIKTRIQADNIEQPKYKGFADCVVQTYEHGGFASFWRGFIPSSIRAFIGNGAIFIIYELCIQIMT